MQTAPDLRFQRDTAWGITQMAFHCPLRFFLWQNALLLSIPPPLQVPEAPAKQKADAQSAPFSPEWSGSRAPQGSHGRVENALEK